MARLPQPGGDSGTWGAVLNDFLNVSHNSDGTVKAGAVSGAQVQDGSISETKLSADVQTKLNSSSSTAHTHVIADTTGLQASLDTKISTGEKGVNNGVATLDGTGKVPASQLPATTAVSDATTTSKGIVQLAGDLGGTSVAPTVPALANKANVNHGHTIADTANLQASLDSKYVKLSSGIPETDLDSAVQAKLNTTQSVNSVAGKTGDVVLVKADVGLGSVDNTSDLGKPISTATQTALDAKAAAAHTHGIADTTGLQTALDAKAAVSHNHAISNVTNLQPTLDAKYVKPGTGIPETDLDSAVQTKLNATGGATTLDGLTDVSSSTATDGQSLVFQAGTWIPATVTSSGGVTDHGALTGLGADHHLQYHNDARGDARYYTKTQVDTAVNVKANSADVYTKAEADTLLGGKAGTTHAHAIADTTGLQLALDGKAATAHAHGIADITNLQTTLDAKVAASEKGAINGVASLGADGKVPAAQLPDTASVADATATSKGAVQLAGDLGGTAAAPTVPGLAAKANDTAVVHNSGIETIAGTKTFSSPVVIAAPTAADHAATKNYVDTGLGGKANTTHAHAIADVTNLQTALNSKVAASEKGSANGVATLGADSKIPQAQLPALALTDVHTVSTEAAMVGLAAQEGDMAIRTDIGKTFVHNGGTAGTTADWSEMLSPSGGVTSVNGQTGVVTLAKNDIGLGNVDNTADLAKPISSATQTALDAKVPTTRTVTAGTGLTGGGDLSANRTLSVTNDSTTQKVELATAGTLRGTRKRLNFVAGSNVTINAADDSTNNKVDITIAATGGGGGYTAVSATASMTAAPGNFVLCNASAGGFTITLPTPTNGAMVRVKKVDNSTNAVLVVPPSGTIDASASASINQQWQSNDFLSDGTQWYFV